jgi:hypothetical protein
MEASFRQIDGPPREIIEADDSVRFVLKDGTKVHRVPAAQLPFVFSHGS